MTTRQVRAAYDAETITVYQAFRPEIADAAVAHGRFVEPFSMARMTWIKPSFLWMMYRCGWATKPGQERVLSIRMTREGFDWALEHGCLSHFDDRHHRDHEAWRTQLASSPVRVQWDPDRSPKLGQLSRRAIQIGLRDEAVRRYVDDWTVEITDITEFVRHAAADPEDRTRAVLEQERLYPLAPAIAERIGADEVQPTR